MSMSKIFRIDYTATENSCGTSRSSTKTVQAYCWIHAIEKLSKHLANKYDSFRVNRATINGELINPDIVAPIYSINP